MKKQGDDRERDAAPEAPAVGDAVLYSPDECHSLDTTVRGDPLWHWQREKDGVPLSAVEVGQIKRAEASGRLVDARDRPVVPAGPLAYWPAVVRAVREDGTLDLDVRHPNGCVVLHYDARRHDAGKAPGTWHHEGE